MQVRLLHMLSLRHQRRWSPQPAGAVVAVADSLGTQLIAAGHARAVEQAPSKRPTRKEPADAHRARR